jgi:hypothetical protein
VSLTKDVPSTPSLVKAAEHSLCQEVTDFNLLENPVPRILGIDDEFVPNTLFDLSHMPLFVIEHFIIALNPDGPKSNAPKEVPILTNFAVFSREPFPKKCLLPVEATIITGSNSTKFVHNESGPSPSLPCLNTIP